MKLLLFFSLFAFTIVQADDLPVLVLITNTITLSAVITGGTPPFNYQWQRNGKTFHSNLSPLLHDEIILNAGDVGIYSCIIENSAGKVVTPTRRLSTTRQADAADVTLTSKVP